VVVKAVEALLRNLPPDLFDVIKAMAEDDLHRVHFTAGSEIRNALWPLDWQL